MIDFLIEERIENKCDKPSFIINHPMLMSPLAKSHAQGRKSGQMKNDHLVAERFELFINNMEVINCYSE